jgi:hypothetical protein
LAAAGAIRSRAHGTMADAMAAKTVKSTIVPRPELVE